MIASNNGRTPPGEIPFQRLARLLEADPRGFSFSAKCPAHDDNVESLSVTETAGGKVLIHCHAGCTAEAVCEALGLHLRDLFPDASAAFNRKGRADAVPEAQSTLFPDRATALRSLDAAQARQGRTRVGKWLYKAASGNVVAAVLRYDGPDGKTFRPISKQRGDGWRVADPPGNWPLFNLAAVEGAERVFVVEGEKCCRLLAGFDVPVVTSAHGAKSATKSNWQPLAGKEVVILPDNDPAGRAYSQDVIRIAAALDPPATAKVVDLNFPGRGVGDDAEQFLAYWRSKGKSDRWLVNTLYRLTDEAELAPSAQNLIRAADPAYNIECARYEPFPVNALPEPLRSFARQGAAALGCDPAYLALPSLAVCTASVGNSRCISLKRDWREPCVLWTAIVGDSGTLKSPALQAATAPLFRIQKRLTVTHREELAAFKAAVATAKAEKTAQAPAEAPVGKRVVCSDTTVEKLASLLADNSRGLLVSRDELSGWLGSFGRYKGSGGGSDLPLWLEAYRAGYWIVDRKTSDRPSLFVPHAAVSVTGGIQPHVLARHFTPDLVESGLPARFLLAWPPRRPKRWTDAEIATEVSQAYERLVEGLLALEPDKDADGDPMPFAVRLSTPAHAAWRAFFAEWAQRQANASGALALTLSKLEGTAARLTLLFHLIARVASNEDASDPVEVEAVEAATALTRWLADEWSRVFDAMGESETERARRKLIDFITARGGTVTARELWKSNKRRYQTTEEATADLDSLALTGAGCWRDRPAGERGGRPTREFLLTPKPHYPETPPECEPGGGESDSPPTPKPGSRPQNPGEKPEKSRVSGFRGNGVRGNEDSQKDSADLLPAEGGFGVTGGVSGSEPSPPDEAPPPQPPSQDGLGEEEVAF